MEPMDQKQMKGERLAPVSGLSQGEEKRFEQEHSPLGKAAKEKREAKMKGENRPAE